ncbi:hypothetical protein DSM110277_03747 (plasmid) [Sulfitobacter pontiacus]|uniref:Membrane protein involved in the export of O-antigen and teichoic acid n=1 Tax=Sulfitobacter pontiacus TaxID=60137 RepID=A0AAX3AGS6_9RHOB|nr:oligosaccharide flippase family protein [Sulfitobacter pontiacus]UOA25293.1 hypothetical protein DSM110277_03747 [Sulfitobacter pontiacus]
MKSTFIYVGFRILTGFLGLFLIAILTRILSQEVYGQYLLLASAGSIGAVFFFQWLNVSTLREYSKAIEGDPAGEIFFLKTINGLFFACSCIGVISSALVATFIWILFDWPNQRIFDVLCAMALALVMSRFTLIQQLLNANSKPIPYGLLMSFRQVLFLCLIGLATYFGSENAITIVIALISSYFFANLIFQPVTRLPVFNLTLQREQCRQLIVYGAPLSINYIVLLFIDMTDRFMLASIQSVALSGQYAATMDFGRMSLGAVANIIYVAYFARMATSFERTNNVNEELDSQFEGFHFLVLVPATLVLILFPEAISNIVFGSSFRATSIQFMPIFAATLFLLYHKQFYLDAKLQLYRRTRTILIVSLFCLFINIALNTVLIPTYGMMGAWAATFVSVCAGVVGSVVATTRLTGSNPVGRIFFTTVLCIIGALLLRSYVQVDGRYSIVMPAAYLLVASGLFAIISLRSFERFSK